MSRKVRVDQEKFDFSGISVKEYLEFFGYESPVRIAQQTYLVKTIGALLPAVEIIH